jgi:NAD-dependent histone deacetylase SIR2
MNPAEEEIFTCLEEDIRRRPDLVIVVGTRLLIPSARDLVKRLCNRTLETGGKTVWVNKSPKSCGLNFSLVW